VSFDQRPPWWLNKVDCCRDDVFLLALVLISTGGKWELVNFSKRLFPEMQTSVSGFLFFLKESNRVFKYLVSVLEKSYSISFCSQVRALYSVRALFHPVQARFHPVGALFHRGWTFSDSVKPSFYPGQAFLL